jgi:hypothetical protein
MRILALIVFAISAFLLVVAIWLAVLTLRFFLGDQYAPFSGPYLFGGRGGLFSGGIGIFIPSVLLFVLGIFMFKFARNLWRN